MPPTREVSRKLLVERIGYWRERLHLTDWAIQVEYKQLDRETDGAAHNQAAHEYKESILRFDPRSLTKGNLDAYVVHELLHCWVWPMAHVAETLAGGNKKHLEWSRVEEERLVTGLERVILALTAPETASASPGPPTSPSTAGRSR